jgi:hypothetical protein
MHKSSSLSSPARLQANAFKNMLKDAGRYEVVRKLKMKESETEPFNEAYEVCLPCSFFVLYQCPDGTYLYC